MMATLRDVQCPPCGGFGHLTAFARRSAWAALAVIVLGGPADLIAQNPSNPGPHPPNAGVPQNMPPGMRGSSNIQVLSHIPLGGFTRVTDVEIEQEPSRPFAYVGKRWQPSGFDVISLEDPENAEIIYSWRIENAELHQGWGSSDGRYFKLNDRYYYVQGTSYRQGGPDSELGAIVFDVTGLPDVSTVEEVGRIYSPEETPGGFHNIYMYKHSDGRALLFATTRSPRSVSYGVVIYDMERFLAGDADHGLVGTIPLPEPRGTENGYHDIYVGYHPDSGQDRFYGPGPEVTMDGGMYVYDVTDVTNPSLLAQIVGGMGQTGAHTFVPTPDGRYGFSMTLGQKPMLVWDLKPGLDGTVPNITRPIGSWTSTWPNTLHNFEVRWPYIFIAGYEESLQVVNVMDPTNPYTSGYYYTYSGPHESRGPGGDSNGAWGIDVRNSDGLIVISDGTTGFWAFKMDGFEGWNGDDWGMPDVSSAQDWDNGPAGARRPVS